MPKSKWAQLFLIGFNIYIWNKSNELSNKDKYTFKSCSRPVVTK